MNSKTLFTLNSKTFDIDRIFDASCALQDASIPDYGLFSMLLLALKANETKAGLLKFNLMGLKELTGKTFTLTIDEDTSEVEVAIDGATVNYERGH